MTSASLSATPTFVLPIRVYYEDTDAGGVVYYANYLRFFERARTEWLRSIGFEQDILMQRQSIAFVARSVQIDYVKSARLDDSLLIVSTIEMVGRAQIVFGQRAERDGDVLVDAKVRIASCDPVRGKAAAMPTEIYEKLKTLIGTPA
jgi:acyl-CoA thioester hydrolase